MCGGEWEYGTSFWFGEVATTLQIATGNLNSYLEVMIASSTGPTFNSSIFIAKLKSCYSTFSTNNKEFESKFSELLVECGIDRFKLESIRKEFYQTAAPFELEKRVIPIFLKSTVEAKALSVFDQATRRRAQQFMSKVFCSRVSTALQTVNCSELRDHIYSNWSAIDDSENKEAQLLELIAKMNPNWIIVPVCFSRYLIYFSLY